MTQPGARTAVESVVFALLLLGLLGATTATTAVADDKVHPPQDRPLALPAGIVWHCYAFGVDGARQSGCYRSRRACSHMGAAQARRVGAPAPTCTSRSSAAAFTFYDATQRSTKYRAFDGVDECQVHRRLHKPPASQTVSRCEVVEATAGSPFDETAIPKGRRWWCATTTTGGDVSTAWCKRTKKECLGYASEVAGSGGTVVSACRRVHSAYATTWVVAGQRRTVTTPTMEDCEDFADYVSGPSRCTLVP